MSPSTLNTMSKNDNNGATQTESNEAPHWLVALAKAGYGARGVIYIIIGSLAFLQAIGQGGNKTDSKGAIEKVLEAPGGVALIWILAASLVGYSTWRLTQSLLDADNHGTDGKGLVIRGGLFTSAVTHIVLAYSAAKIALNAGSSGGGSKESIVATLLSWPAGPWIVGLIGLTVAGAGIAHIIKAKKEKYKKRFAIDSDLMSKLNPICKFGLYAKGASFLIIAGFFIYAAATQDSDKAGGMKEVLSTVSSQPYGPYLLGVLAVGLASFGCYSIIEALYRKIDYKG